MRSHSAVAVLASAAFAAACGPKVAPSASSAPVQQAAAPQPRLPPALITDGGLVTPVQSLSIDTLLTLTIASNAMLLQTADADIVDQLRDRIGPSGWVFKDALQSDFMRNQATLTDPHRLAVLSLIEHPPAVGSSLPDVLAGQLRTMIALQKPRLVLIPAQLRLVKPPNGERGVSPQLLIVIADARSAQVVWTGVVTGKPAPGFSPALTANAASALAALFPSAGAGRSGDFSGSAERRPSGQR